MWESKCGAQVRRSLESSLESLHFVQRITTAKPLQLREIWHFSRIMLYHTQTSTLFQTPPCAPLSSMVLHDFFSRPASWPSCWWMQNSVFKDHQCLSMDNNLLASCWCLWQMWVPRFGEGDRSIVYSGYSLAGWAHGQSSCRQRRVEIVCNHTGRCCFDCSQLLQLL
jgi:hypothetical protein